jgi:hypothetical protein
MTMHRVKGVPPRRKFSIPCLEMKVAASDSILSCLYSIPVSFAPYFLFAATPFDQSPLRRILSRRISRQMKMMLLKMTWMMKWLISSWTKRKLMGMAKL